MSEPLEREAGPKVLYVDDQLGNIVVFKANFRKHLRLSTETSPKRALELAERDSFAVVISDQKMDEMPGIEFLAEIAKRRPESVRILMTAYTNFEHAVAAINGGHVWRFVTKPWEPQDLLATLLGASELYDKTIENQRLTEQLLHHERLSAIGQLTSGLVHELGNVASLLAVAEDLDKEWRAGTDLSREFEILQTGVHKFRLLVDSLRIYAKGGAPLEIVARPVDIGELLTRTMVILRLFPAIKRVQRLEVIEPPNRISAPIDANKIQQVLFNVIKNAAEACPHSCGAIVVSVATADGRAIIEIADNGPGISAEAAKRVWDGFYTTKGDKGTGLGLVMCRKIIRAHGGEIDFHNREGGGCTFRIALPSG